MATRALLIHAVINATDRPSNINIAASQQVAVYEMDGVTLLEQPMYASQTGGAPIANPLTSNSSGMVVAYADLAQSVIVKVNGVAFTTAFSPWPQLPFWYEDVRAHGASTSASPSTNRAAIQGAIDTVVARGGGTVFLPELYHISGASLTAQMGGISQNLVILGNGRWTSGVIQDTPGVDTLTLGTRGDLSAVDGITVKDLLLGGGRYNLHLIDAINGDFRSLHLGDGQVGLFSEGQNESCQFDYLYCYRHTDYSIYLGYDGGYVGNVESQKCAFYKLRLQPLPNSINAIKITGKSGSPSGNVHFRDLTIETGGGTGNLIDVDWCFQSTWEHVTNECTQPLAVSNVASVMKLGTHNQTTIVKDSYLAGSAGADHATNWKYGIEQRGGQLFVENTAFVGAAQFGTAAIYVGTALQASGCVFGTAAQVVWQDAAARQHSLMGLCYDGAGNVITGWDGSVPFISVGTHPFGTVMMPGQMLFGEQAKATITGQANILASGVNFSLGSTAMGLYLLADTASGNSALLMLRGGAHAVTSISDPGGICATTDVGVGAGTWALYWDIPTSRYLLKNETAAARGYRLLQLDQYA